MPEAHAEFDDLLREDRTISPPPEFRAQAHVRDERVYAEAERDPEGFWAAFASELEWSRRWDKVFDWQPPHAKWFVGGTINVSVNCLDRHVRGPRRNKAALIWEGEPGDRRTPTHFDLRSSDCRVRHAEGRPAEQRKGRRGSQGSRRQEDRRPRAARRHPVRSRSPKNALGQNHAAAAA